jgi:hypothetical protein
LIDIFIRGQGFLTIPFGKPFLRNFSVVLALKIGIINKKNSIVAFFPRKQPHVKRIYIPGTNLLQETKSPQVGAMIRTVREVEKVVTVVVSQPPQSGAMFLTICPKAFCLGGCKSQSLYKNI